MWLREKMFRVREQGRREFVGDHVSKIIQYQLPPTPESVDSPKVTQI